MPLPIHSRVNETSYHLFQSYHYRPRSARRKDPESASIKASPAYRDATLWRLLCLEKRVRVEHLMAYWEILDVMMDISLCSAISLLQHIYEYKVRRLEAWERAQLYPGISNDLFRLEYHDEQGGYRDVCGGTLIHEAIDLLQAEAERFIQQ